MKPLWFFDHPLSFICEFIDYPDKKSHTFDNQMKIYFMVCRYFTMIHDTGHMEMVSSTDPRVY
ncbi:MAG: hypothetical protein WCR01_03705 [Bacteroidota bacterium]